MEAFFSTALGSTPSLPPQSAPTSIGPSKVGASREWMRKRLLFDDPLYLVNYLYAAVVAVALYDRAHTDLDFASKFEALLRSGFDAEPQAILARMGIRLDDPSLVKAAARLLQTRTDELQQLYRTEGQPSR
jgi:oligoendopeptidase F